MFYGYGILNNHVPTLKATTMGGGSSYIGLLDTYSGAIGAYSLRKLRSAYTGYAIRVRRSSDNTSQDIGFKVDGTLDTTTLTTFVGANSGFVSIWYDQANTNNLIQNTSTNQLRIISSGTLDILNGKPSLYNQAGGINRFLKVSFGSNLSQPNTYFHLGSHSTSGYVFDNYTATVQSAIYQGTSTSMRLYAGVDLNLSFTPSITTQRLIFALTNSTTSRIGVNGTAGVTGNSGTGYMNGLTLGAAGNDSLSSQAYHQEFIVWNSNQTTNRTGIETNINAFYTTY
jgi:hypothetical protein